MISISVCNMSLPEKSECRYSSHYCEENIWHLCKIAKDRISSIDTLNVVFISNDHKTIPLWCQKSTGNDNTPVVWDYHVILVDKRPPNSLVYDLDSTLPFPTSFQQYCQSALRNDVESNPRYRRKFRVIPADRYLKDFSSDRSHMKGVDGQWLQPPPRWPPIFNGVANSLDQFWSMAKAMENSSVMDGAEFHNYFTTAD